MIIKKIEEFDKVIDRILDNFPKRDRVLKEELINTIREIYININKIIYDYNINIGMYIISNIKYLNYLIDIMYKKKIINNKRYLYIGNLVIDITKLLRGYINEKNK